MAGNSPRHDALANGNMGDNMYDNNDNGGR
jgi:hypothetical protein